MNLHLPFCQYFPVGLSEDYRTMTETRMVVVVVTVEEYPLFDRARG